MHGRSFLPVVQGQTDQHRPAIITGYHQAVDRCIRDARLSYVERPDEQPDELYDLAEDPREQRNLVDDLPEEAKRLKASFGDLYRQRVSRVVKGIQGAYEMGSAAVE
jgi:arylsulfatase A-like enzyme